MNELIDKAALRYERVTLAGDDEVVEVITRGDIDAAPTVECGACEHWQGTVFYDAAVIDHAVCALGVTTTVNDCDPPADFGCSNFQRRQP